MFEIIIYIIFQRKIIINLLELVRQTDIVGIIKLNQYVRGDNTTNCWIS